MVIVIALIIGWWFHEPIEHGFSRYFRRHTSLPAVDTTVGAPSPRGLERTQAKIDRLKEPAAADSVVLSPNELASLIGSSLDWSVRKNFDSLRVELHEGSVAIYCRLDTRVIPPDAIGPLASMMRPMEPLRIAGPVRIEKPGVARWRIEELSLRGIPFPGPVARRLAQQVAGADSDGAVPLQVSPSVRAIAVHTTGVVLYGTKSVRRP